MRGASARFLGVLAAGGLLAGGCITKRVYEPVVMTPSGDVIAAQGVPSDREARGSVPPSVSYFWAKGYWACADRRWVWIPGHWQAQPRPGSIWIPGHWDHTERGWVWTPGIWE